MFSCDDISGINDIRLISSHIQASNHELHEIEIKILPINVVDKRIFVGLLGKVLYYSLYAQAPGSLFVTYDLQGCGGNIPVHLHTAIQMQ
jgi:hypothetical protein